MASWTRNQTEKLIAVIQTYPNLCQKRHMDYKNRAKKSKSFKEVVEKIKCHRPETSVQDVVLKLRTLKTQYLKEKNNIIRSKVSGAKEVYVPKLWCYNKLYFWDEGENEVFEEESNVKQEYLEPTSPEMCFETDTQSLPDTSSSLNSFQSIFLKENANITTEKANSLANKSISFLHHFLGNLEEEMMVVTDKALMREMKWKIYDVVKDFQRKQMNKA